MRRIRTLLHYYDGLPIYQKLLVSLIVISVIPVLLIQIISFIITNSAMQTQTDDFTNLHLRQAYNHIDSLFSRYNSIIANLNQNDDVIVNLKEVNLWSRNYSAAKNRIRSSLKESTNLEEGIIGTAIIPVSGETIYYDSVSLSNTESFCLNLKNILSSQMYKEAIQTKSIVYGYTSRIQDENYGRHNIIYICKQVVDIHNPVAGPMGVVVLSIDESYLRKLYQDDSSDWNTSFLISKNGTILSFPDESYIGKNIGLPVSNDPSAQKQIRQFTINSGLLDTGNLIINSLSKEEGEFMLVDVLDEGYMVRKIRVVSAVIIILGLIAVVFAVMVTTYTSNQAKKSVMTITDAMREANHGNLNATVNLMGNDEFAFIGRNYNHMLNRIKKLIEHNRRALVRQKEAEIQALEAQINPHFLYNTLDAINWMAIDHEEHEISQMLKDLALILRYSIQNSNGIVTLREDLSYIRKYISLQQKRYDYSFECMLRVQEEAYSVPIHKLLIQPLVENILIHAFPGEQEQDQIDIYITLEADEFLNIRITDNGIGMEDALVQELNQYDHRAHKGAPGIGIRNVIARVQMYYGARASFTIQSTIKTGTEVQIIIPIHHQAEGEPNEDTNR